MLILIALFVSHITAFKIVPRFQSRNQLNRLKSDYNNYKSQYQPLLELKYKQIDDMEHIDNITIQTNEQLPLLMPFLSLPFLFIVLFNLVGISPALAIENFSFDPSQFQPICHFSDVIYQFLKFVVSAIIGLENVNEYGPIVASLLLRVRLELCVIESYFFEAVVPFIKERGLSWILPLHETVETFLTGSIFAIATNIILLTSTKIINFLFLCIDVLTGMPTRFISNILTKFTKDKTVNNNIPAFILATYGNTIGTVRRLMEGIDTFISKYLFFTTIVYVVFKYIHYKFFNFI